MPIKRSPHNPDNPFTMVSKRLSNDRNLSFQALGLMNFLLSKRDDHYFTVRELIYSHLNNRDSIYSIINELVNAGYIFRKQYHGDFGRFTNYYFHVFENPIKTTSQPHTASPEAVRPDTVEPEAVMPEAVINKIVLKLKRDKITTSTTVLNTIYPVDVSLLKKNKERILELFVSLGIFNHNIILAKYNNSDILKYVSWMNSVKPKFDNATAFLISAIKEKWDISGSSVDTSSSSGRFKYECRKCNVSRNYSFSILDYKFCNKCTVGKY